jgi:AraC-like DNA-binding protein
MKKTVSASIDKRLIQSLQDVGVSWSEITNSTGIYPSEINAPQGRIDALKHYRLLNLLNKKSTNLDWAITEDSYTNSILFDREHVRNMLSEDSYSLIMLCMNCSTLREALEYYYKYRLIIANVDTLSLNMTGTQTSIVFAYEFPEFNCHFISLINFIVIISMIEYYCGQENTFHVETCLDYTKTTSYIFNYWNCVVDWSKEIDSIVFDSCLLDIKNVYFNPILFKVALHKVNDEYSSISDTASFSDIVEQVIYEDLHKKHEEYSEAVVMDAICERYNITRSTVYRKLCHEHTSFRQLEAKVKLQEGLHMLKNTEFSIGKISAHLGFSSQSSFNRFFSERMHISPSRYRRCDQPFSEVKQPAMLAASLL